MKHRFTKIATSVAIAAGLVFAAPAMAQAYTPGGNISVVSDAPFTVSGNTYTFSGFDAGATVTFTLTGENGAGASLAIAKFAVSSTSTTKTADSSGAASVAVTLPSNATGEYTLKVAGALAPSNAGGGTLPSTGGDSESLLGIWVGGGALVLAGATVAVAATVRRNRQESNA